MIAKTALSATRGFKISYAHHLGTEKPRFDQHNFQLHLHHCIQIIISTFHQLLTWIIQLSLAFSSAPRVRQTLSEPFSHQPATSQPATNQQPATSNHQSVKMSFQDRAQHQISQLDKEVCTPTVVAYDSLSYLNPIHSFRGLPSTISRKWHHDDCLLIRRSSFPNILHSTTLRGRPRCLKSTSFLVSSVYTPSSYSSISPVPFSSISLGSSSLDTIHSMRCSVPARLMIHRYAFTSAAPFPCGSRLDVCADALASG